MFDELVNNTFVWFPEKGIGYYPVSANPYNKEYFQNYQERASTEIGRCLTKARVDLVLKYYQDIVLDVGIGSGQFVKEYGYAFGFDINPEAIKWLQSNNLYRCLYTGYHDAVTFWDSLEHIALPDTAIMHIKKYAFVSMPIYENDIAILNSKHFKKNEHYWYFTRNGLIQWFSYMGFDCMESNSMETDLGREEIETFVFRRRDD